METRTPEIELLHERLEYLPETGQFIWRVGSRRRAAGIEAGNVSIINGYRYIGCGGKIYPAHRLAWLFIHGEWPSQVLDHKDRNRSNNAIHNLRPSDRSGNSANSGLSRLNKSGARGVWLDARRGKYMAKGHSDNRSVFLGYFVNFEEAVEARDKFAAKQWGEFAYLNKAAA